MVNQLTALRKLSYILLTSTSLVTSVYASDDRTEELDQYSMNRPIISLTQVDETYNLKSSLYSTSTKISKRRQRILYDYFLMKKYQEKD